MWDTKEKELGRSSPHRALSVRKYFAMLHANEKRLGAWETMKAEKGSGWNIAAWSCPAV